MTDAAPAAASPASLKIPLWEFVALSASLMALNALAIDVMLPALGLMQEDFGFTRDNDRQLVIVMYVMTFGVSQLIFGPLTDRFGRRRVLMATLLLYVAAGLVCIMAPSYGALLAARMAQGAASGATRVVSVSIVRDLYSGRRMAEIMSLIMMVFMAVPIVAPSLGQIILLTFGEWRAIFWMLAGAGAIVLVWSYLRLPETLPLERRKPISPSAILTAYGEILSHRVVLGYTIANGFFFGGLFAFIAAAEQIFVDVYDIPIIFPIYFAGAAAVMSLSNLFNSRLVMAMGMRKLSHAALIAFTVVSGFHALLAGAGLTPFPVFYVLLLLGFLCMGFVGPNMNAITMEPLGALAGSAAAILGFATTTVSGFLGWVIGQGFDGTTTPILIGHFLLGAAALAAIYVTERGRLFQSGET